jgi:transcriptional regulator with XRE-family HTH domain
VSSPSGPIEAFVKKIGTVLRDARLRAGLSQDAVARRCGMATSQISQIERGRSGSPEFATVAKIAPVVGVSLDEIAAACGYPGFNAGSARASIGLRNLVVLAARIQKSRKHFSALVNALEGVESQVDEELHELTRGERKPGRRRRSP